MSPALSFGGPGVNPMAMRDTGPATTHGAHAGEAPACTERP
jgi:hypothetical protein